MHTQTDMDVMAHHTLQDLVETILSVGEMDRRIRSDPMRSHVDKF